MVYRLICPVDDKYLVVHYGTELVFAPGRIPNCVCVHCRTGRGQPHLFYELRAYIQHQGWIPTPRYEWLIGTHNTEDEVKNPYSVGSNLMVALSGSSEEVEEMKRTLERAIRAARTSFDSPFELDKLFLHVPSTILTHVGLNFSIREYMWFFGSRMLPVHDRYFGMMHHLLYNTTTLEKLDIKLRDPRWSVWDHPWTSLPHRPQDAARLCTAKIMNSILPISIPYLSAIKKVRLEGHIRQDLRDIFEITLYKFRNDSQYRSVHMAWLEAHGRKLDSWR
jgi:hypothetical protein